MGSAKTRPCKFHFSLRRMFISILLVAAALAGWRLFGRTAFANWGRFSSYIPVFATTIAIGAAIGVFVGRPGLGVVGGLALGCAVVLFWKLMFGLGFWGM